LEPESRRAVIIGYVNAKPIIVQASNKKFKLCTRKHSYQFDFLPLIRTSHMELPSFLFLKKKGRKNYFTIDKTIRYYLFPITIRYYGLMVTWKAKTCRHFWVIWFKFGRVVAKYWLCYAHWFKYRQSIMFMSCVSSSSFFSLLCDPYS